MTDTNRTGTTHAPRQLSPIMKAHLARLPRPDRAAQDAALRDLRQRRVEAWAAVLSDPARSPAALARAVPAAVTAPHVNGLPGLMWSQGCREAARSRPRSPARARLPAFARMLAGVLAGALDDHTLRAAAEALAAITPSPARDGLRSSPHPARARRAVADLDDRVRRIVDANLGLVAAVADGMSIRGISAGMAMDDLVALGVLGLERAVRSFDPGRGVALGTYAWPWIRHAIARAIQDTGRTIRVPVGMQEAAHRVRVVARGLVDALGREPTEEEVAAAFGGKAALAKVRKVAEIPMAVNATDLRVDDWDDAGREVFDVVADPSPNPEEAILAVERERQVVDLLSRLPPRLREAAEVRLGLRDGDVHHRTAKQAIEALRIMASGDELRVCSC